jgi:hypothetical protein
MLIKLSKTEGTKKAFRTGEMLGVLFLCCAILVGLGFPSAHAAPKNFDPELAAQIQLQKLLKTKRGGRGNWNKTMSIYFAT